MNNSGQTFYEKKHLSWDPMKDVGPAARHTRRIIVDWVKTLEFVDVIDISCGAGQLLSEIKKNLGKDILFGTEFTEKAVEINRKKHIDMNFVTFDLEIDPPLPKRDLVLCIDVLEHINNDQIALEKLRLMTNKYLIIAVPLGRVSNSERESLGHLNGYKQNEFRRKLISAGFSITKSLQWGFPFYQFTRGITNIFPQSPAEGETTPFKKIIFRILYRLYFASVPIFGGRFFVLCEPKP